MHPPLSLPFPRYSITTREHGTSRFIQNIRHIQDYYDSINEINSVLHSFAELQTDQEIRIGGQSPHSIW